MGKTKLDEFQMRKIHLILSYHSNCKHKEIFKIFVKGGNTPNGIDIEEC